MGGQEQNFDFFDDEIISLPDLNRDGHPELVVAAVFATVEPDLGEAGRISVLNGASLSALTQPVTSVADLGASDRLLIEGLEEQFNLGDSLATIAMLDGDELPELVIS
ncbi:MAG: hypothetical protein AAF654_13785 [Myxococcota bacterium]